MARSLTGLFINHTRQVLSVRIMNVYRPPFIYCFSLLAAPLLLAISSFFWREKEYGITAGTLIVFSTVFWILALDVLFKMIKDRYPNYAAWGFLVAITGFISGSNFAFVGIISEMFGISHGKYIEVFAK